MMHPANPIVVEQDRGHIPARLGFPARLAHDRDQSIAQHLRTAPNVMAAAQQIRRLGYGECDERYRFGIIGIVGNVRRECELDRFVIAEQALQAAEGCLRQLLLHSLPSDTKVYKNGMVPLLVNP
jgi:hypothetical protein